MHLKNSLLRRLLCAMFLWTSANALACAQEREDTIVLTAGNTRVKISPAGGANVYSIAVGDIEFLHPPAEDKSTAGVSCGTPILYPTPNRVRNGKFIFNQETVEYQPNAGKHFIHGLVNRHAWKVVAVEESQRESRVRLVADFSPGTDLAEQFPFPHQLYVEVRVRPQQVRWTYTVDNRQGNKDVPFGFALHPYFRYQGSREDTFLTVPATHLMESEQRLPNGNLIPAEEIAFPGFDFALNKPCSLGQTALDDVFWGMPPNQATLIDFREQRSRIAIQTSPDFTHLVVWTPGDNKGNPRSFFGVENQTCSTDAHNLHHLGFRKEAHLQICPTGQQRSGWVEYSFALPSTP